MTLADSIGSGILPGLVTAIVTWLIGLMLHHRLQAAGSAMRTWIWGAWVVRMVAILLIGTTLSTVPHRLGWQEVAVFGLPLPGLVNAALLIGLGALAIRRTTRLLTQQLDSGGHAWSSMVANKAVTYGGVIVLLILVADAIGIDLTALLATAGVVGIAVGWAAQTSLSNVIAGVFLLVDRPFTVGDVIMLEGQLGTVERISLMSTFVRTFDNLVVRWPNEVVLKATVTNYSSLPVRRVDLSVRIPADAPLGKVLDTLRAAVPEAEHVLLEPAAEVRVVDLFDNGVTLSVRAWFDRTDFLGGRDAVIRTVQAALVDIGVPPRVPRWEVQLDDTSG